jgi:hypothetical protein
MTPGGQDYEKDLTNEVRLENDLLPARQSQ